MRTPRFWSAGRGDAVAPLLTPLAALYSAGTQVSRAFVMPVRVDVPVICVGNVVAGGAGKTPTALALAKLMKEWGVTAHFLTRGYGGTARGPLRVDPKRHSARQVGDEPLLLARRAPTWLAHSRPAGARTAIADGADAIIMDDGFQNPSLVKDISLMVVDGGFGFGNGRLLPAGPLREPIARGLARADAIVLIGADEAGIAARLGGGGVPLLRAELTPTLRALKLRERAVVAFAGIGRPAKFFQTLEAIGCNIVRRVAFADHRRFMTLVEYAGAEGAIPVTTEKDWVRLPEEAKPMIEPVPVTLEWQDPNAVERIIRPALAGAARTDG
jgi:tetraacyldisaccharide 4'-kinase